MNKFSFLNLHILLSWLLFIMVPISAFAQGSCPGSSSVCIYKSPYALSGATPSGGVYNGRGVSDGIFSPAVAGVGYHTITYSYTGTNGLTQNCKFTIEVYEQIPRSCPLAYGDPVFCLGSSPQKQIPDACTPAVNNPNITFTGVGFVDNTFYPAIAGVGIHTYTRVVEKDGCSYTKTSNMYVVPGDPPPIITCPENMIIPSASSAPVTLPGAGTFNNNIYYHYKGPGISRDEIFTPSVAGLGIHQMAFVVENVAFGEEGDYLPSGMVCVNECTFTINVGTLPVTLTKFEAKSLDNGINLSWGTVSETNFDHFELERSVDPQNGFYKIHEISGSSLTNRYEFTDKEAFAGTPWYYRLKMIDKDLSFAYSKIVWAMAEGDSKLIVFPNPAINQFSVQSPWDIVEIKLINASGYDVIKRTFEKTKVGKLVLPKIAQGVYLIEAKTAEGKSSFSKLVVE